MEVSIPDKGSRELDYVVRRMLDNLASAHKAVTGGTGYDPEKYSSTYSEAADLIRRLHEMAAPSAKNAPWINPAHQFPDEGQEVRFMPLSGNVFNGWYTNDLKTGNPHIDGASAFVRGDGASKIMHASYTPSVVMWWMPLPSAPTDGGTDK